VWTTIERRKTKRKICNDYRDKSLYDISTGDVCMEAYARSSGGGYTANVSTILVKAAWFAL